MMQLILNDDHLAGALGEALSACRRRLFIATADVKNLHLPLTHASPQTTRGSMAPRKTTYTEFLARRGRGSQRTGRPPARSIVEFFRDLSARDVEISLLHSGVPSESFLEELKTGGVPTMLTMRRCPRIHAKAVIADGRWMYLGSANLTGAGLGAKSQRRRNFEAGICTDDLGLIDGVTDMLQTIWDGSQCASCGRKEHCAVPLEEPEL